MHELRDTWQDRLTIETVDVNRPDDVAELGARLHGRSLDMVFVNAGVKNDDRETIADVKTAEFERVMVTNALSPLRAIETFGT